MRTLNCLQIASLALLLAVSLPASAQFTTNVITFDEVSTRPVDGLIVEGVTFRARTPLGAPELFAQFNARNGLGLPVGPGETPFNTPPNLEGPSGTILTLDFASPSSLLQFGSHLSVVTNVPVGLTVQLYDPMLLAMGSPIPLAMMRATNFAGGLFEYSGAVFQRAVITTTLIDSGLSGGQARFTIDNLTFTAVPEPSTWVIGVLATAFALFARRGKAW